MDFYFHNDFPCLLFRVLTLFDMKRITRICVLIWTAVLGCVSSYLWSQDSLKVRQLDEVVLSASRKEQSVLETTKSVSVISREEIENSGSTTVAELLSTQQGIHLIGVGQTPGALQSLFLRGANSEHTAILVDGVRITDPSSESNALDLSELSLAAVERIEIVRGTHSTLYGSSAIGGLIHIITKKGSEGFAGSVQTEMGVLGEGSLEFSERVDMQFQTKKGWYATASLFQKDTDGLDATLDTITQADVYRTTDKDGFHKRDVHLKAGFQDRNLDFFLAYKKVDQDLEIDDAAFNDDDNSSVAFHRDVVTYKMAYQLNPKTKIQFLGGYTAMNRTVVNDSSVVAFSGEYDHSFVKNHFDGTVFTNEFQWNYETEPLSVVFGISDYKETMNSQLFYLNTEWKYTSESDLTPLGINTTTRSAFANLNLSGEIVSEKASPFQLTLGTRTHHHSSFGNTWTYEINPSFNLGKGRVYATMATAFNAPALYRLYTPDANLISGVTRGNPDLQPETAQSYELGWKQQVSSHTHWSISAFQTEVKNLIEYVYLWDAAIPLSELGNDWQRDDYRGDTYDNLGTQTNTGLEVSLQMPISEHLRLTTNGSIVNGKLKYSSNLTNRTEKYHVQLYNSGDFITQQITREGLTRRAHTANANLRYRIPQSFSIALNVRHVGRRNDVFYNADLGPFGALSQNTLDDYTLIAVQFQKQITDKLKAVFAVKNVMDVQYQEINGYATRGRNFWLQLRCALKP